MARRPAAAGLDTDFGRACVAESARDGLIDFEPHVTDVAQSPLRILLETARQQPPDRRGCRRRQRGPIGFARDDGGDDVGDGLAGERAAAREHFVEHDAERPDVRALVDRLPARLLRRHVGRGAEDHAQLRGAGA